MDVTQPHRFVVNSDDYRQYSVYTNIPEYNYCNAFIHKFNDCFGTDREIITYSEPYGSGVILWYGCALFDYDGSDSDVFYIFFRGVGNNKISTYLKYSTDGGTTYTNVPTIMNYGSNLKEPSVTFGNILNGQYSITSLYPTCYYFCPVKSGYGFNNFYDSRSDQEAVQNAMEHGIPRYGNYFLKCKDVNDGLHTGIVVQVGGANMTIGMTVPEIDGYLGKLISPTQFITNTVSSLRRYFACRLIGDAEFDVLASIVSNPSSWTDEVSMFFRGDFTGLDSMVTEFISYDGKTYMTTLWYSNIILLFEA